MTDIKCKICGSTERVQHYTLVTPATSASVYLCTTHAKPVNTLVEQLRSTGDTRQRHYRSDLTKYVSTIQRVNKLAREQQYEKKWKATQK